ncbi:hypothetical protein RMSM_06742 [Rhodopirellula maiorica SM1]|uniref:Uncharacterized protein n=1 Tax=Rhodopirellula maiorica SM1 TaxID=1265738 RepID=M5RA24_9BACT|nr:hypothetical protein RMSM_06742 [Rhodopirellula maiorica SM1]
MVRPGKDFSEICERYHALLRRHMSHCARSQAGGNKFFAMKDANLIGMDYPFVGKKSLF